MTRLELIERVRWNSLGEVIRAGWVDHIDLRQHHNKLLGQHINRGSHEVIQMSLGPVSVDLI